MDRSRTSFASTTTPSIKGIGKRRRDHDVDLARKRMHKVSDDAAATRPSHIAAHPRATVNIDAGISCKSATSSLFAPQTQGWMPMPILSHPPPQIHEGVMQCHPPPQTQGVMPMPMTLPSHFGAHPLPTISYTCTAAPTDDGVIREMLQQNEFLFEQMTQNIASDYLMRNIDLFIQIKENMTKITTE